MAIQAAPDLGGGAAEGVAEDELGECARGRFPVRLGILGGAGGVRVGGEGAAFDATHSSPAGRPPHSTNR